MDHTRDGHLLADQTRGLGRIAQVAHVIRLPQGIADAAAPGAQGERRPRARPGGDVSLGCVPPCVAAGPSLSEPSQRMENARTLFVGRPTKMTERADRLAYRRAIVERTSCLVESAAGLLVGLARRRRLTCRPRGHEIWDADDQRLASWHEEACLGIAVPSVCVVAPLATIAATMSSPRLPSIVALASSTPV